MSHYKLVVTDPAKRDFREILTYTIERYGREHAKAYDALIRQAFRDLESDPLRIGTKDRPEISDGFRTYHISLSKSRAASKIKSPRHFVLYFLPGDNEVVVSRILHDSRDLPHHLPDAHREVMRRAQLPSRKKPSRKKGRER